MKVELGINSFGLVFNFFMPSSYFHNGNNRAFCLHHWI